MATNLKIAMDLVVALRRRGWTITDDRHGWDAVCMSCGWADNFLSTQGLWDGCNDHDRAEHLPH